MFIIASAVILGRSASLANRATRFVDGFLSSMRSGFTLLIFSGKMRAHSASLSFASPIADGLTVGQPVCSALPI
jgi:hypothetical protein